MKAKLIEVQGDQEEYADLIGTTGELHLKLGDEEKRTNPTFLPQGRGDWLTMISKRTTRSAERITVKTKLGNTFVFAIGLSAWLNK